MNLVKVMHRVTLLISYQLKFYSTIGQDESEIRIFITESLSLGHSCH